MKTKLSRLARDQTGGIGIDAGASLFWIFLLVLIVAQCAAAYYRYDYALDLLQRTVNSAVEANIRDEYRSDHILKLDTGAAETAFYRYLQSDLVERSGFSVSVDTVTTAEFPPSMTASGTVSFPAMLSGLGLPDLSFRFVTSSTNYDLDG